jgi:kinesin family member 15
MNRESSRSHCVLICSIRSRKSENGVISTLSSRLNLVDLAGSEQQKASGASGERLREASNINKSLSILGRVINSLSQQQKSGVRVIQHVPYRDSKLTFLLQVCVLGFLPVWHWHWTLHPSPHGRVSFRSVRFLLDKVTLHDMCDTRVQDSLGGNSKTVMIANISPSTHNITETQSTLRFAQRAKKMGNKAVINENAAGDIEALRKEVLRLKQELAAQRGVGPADKPFASPAAV